MKRLIGPITASAAVGIFGLANQAQAVTTVNGVAGTMGRTAHGCLQLLTFSVADDENCMYDSGPPATGIAAGSGDTIGPVSQMTYYSDTTDPTAFSTGFTPANGDGKINQTITGTLTIDDGGNGFGAGDLISFTLTMTDPLGGKIIRNSGANVSSTSTIAEKWTSMTQVMAPQAASSATANTSGGFDYIIGTEGFPGLLTFGDTPTSVCDGQTFGNMECPGSFTAGVPDPDRWTPNNTSGGPGVGSLESNIGAGPLVAAGTLTTLVNSGISGSLVGYECVDNGLPATGTPACRTSQIAYAPLLGTNGPNAAPGGGTATERGAAEDVGWDQLLLRVSTNGAGALVSLAGFDVEEYRVFGQTRCGDNTTGTGSYLAACNSWVSGYFTAVPVPAAAWLLAPAFLAVGRFARRRKNA